MDEKFPKVPAAPRTVSDVLQVADVALDSYDEIFSDFDPSPYTTRLLSEDFIRELRRRCTATGKGDFVVNFTLPRALRSEKIEGLVRKRIRDHFRSNLSDIEKAAKEKTRRGLLRIALGVAISVPLFFLPVIETLPVLTVLSVLMWYALWSGFEHVFEVSARLERKKMFYDKFLRADYNFVNQEDVVQLINRLQPEPNQKAGQKSQGSS
ncbi:MAG TPA: hypothetical protein VLD37_05400 [Candidatus Bilamarchaeum sp.]|nr:hypothetical protein [Candidatus Bilamarchaeum sp.]